MNIAVKHNGSTITSRVVSYNREHKICTGIGTLDLVIESTYSTTIDPWDEIDIWENGSFQVRYYVSDVSESIPDGTITLTCQDISKRLVDYFIPDTYSIDYPSYTRYWIEKFLAEAGLTYEFTTSSQGNLLSNNTALGLQPAYDQIMMLLQLSGWFMYFDGNGKAIIGSLDVDLADLADSVNRTDILDIKRITNDKMLRNRAVVWGQYDPIGGEYAFADISKHTPWNYDIRDIRSMVVSNSNIPNKSSAYNIANILLKEFSRATIEKHIVLWGARNYNLGEALQVASGVWRGKGLITTFGVQMERNGLVTSLILDERCPRLFGFFNFGDYVYVGTFGDGIWRKHIKFDPTWYDFSSGLTDLNITDLHINQGVLGSVGHSGDMYYAGTEGPWIPITRPESLVSSAEDQVDTISGVLSNGVPFSGIMARAVIVDKGINTVKFGVDTYSGLNMGDYFLAYSGMISASGVTTSGSNRGWILEYDNGVILGDLGSGVYPIQYSGNYDIRVLDLENDGRNDYVSVATGGEGGPTVTGDNGNYGHHYTQPFASTKDYSAFHIYPGAESIEDINNMYRGDMEFAGPRVQNANALIAIDDQISGYTFSVAVGKDKVARKSTFTRVYDSGNDLWDVQVSTVTSPANTNIATVIGIYPSLGANTFRVFYWEAPVSGSVDFYYSDWDATANTWGSEVLITTAVLQGAGGPSMDALSVKTMVSGETSYNLMYYRRSPAPVGGYFVDPSFMYVDVTSVHMPTSVATHDPILEFETEEYETSGRYYFFNSIAGTATDPIEDISATNPTFEIFQNGQTVKIIGRMEVYHYYLPDSVKSTKEYLFAGSSSVIQSNEVYSDTQITSSNIRRFPTSIGVRSSQLTEISGIIVGNSVTAGADSWVFDGTIFLTYAAPGGSGEANFPFQFRPSAIYPMFVNNGNLYIAFDSGTNLFYKCSANSLSVVEAIEPPTNYDLEAVTSMGIGSFGSSIYAVIQDNVEFRFFMCPYNFSSFDFSRRIYPNDNGSETVPNFSRRTVNFGNFFIEDAGDYLAAQPQAGVYYVDLGTPDWDTTAFLVLQREGMDYNLIQQSSKPIRIDISNTSPVLTVLDTENTFISNFVGVEELTQVIPISGLLARDVRDYRYTLLETTSSGTIVDSGEGLSSQILYVTESGVYHTDARTYSGGFLLMDTIYSGMAERIETTNYTYPGQFIFVTTSGDSPAFYQKDNDGFSFVYYSGLPNGSRSTIIRVDDMI